MAAITDLTTASSVGAGDYLVISQSNTDKKVTANKFAIVAAANTFTADQTINKTGSAAGLALTSNADGDSGIYIADVNRGWKIGVDVGGSGNGRWCVYDVTSGAVRYMIDTNGDSIIPNLAGTGNRAVYSTSIGLLTNTASDERLKANISPIGSDEALALVGALEPVRYNWLDQERRGAQREIGLIAQQVQPHVPEIVGTNEDGTLSLDYPKLTALLIGAVQELTARIAELETAIVR